MVPGDPGTVKAPAAAPSVGGDAAGSVLDDALVEDDAALDRTPHGAAHGDLLEPAHELGREGRVEVHDDVEPPRRRPVVVVDVDADLAELEPAALRVHRKRRRDARGEGGREELV